MRHTQTHKQILGYELATTEQLYERGQQLPINRPPLRWDTQHQESARR